MMTITTLTAPFPKKKKNYKKFDTQDEKKSSLYTLLPLYSSYKALHRIEDLILTFEPAYNAMCG